MTAKASRAFKRLSEVQAADGFAALGNRARLRLLKLLVRAGTAGLTVSDIGRLMHMPASTLAHHLAALVRAGLVTSIAGMVDGPADV